VTAMTFAEHLAELGQFETGAALVGVFALGLVPIQLLGWGVARLMDAIR